MYSGRCFLLPRHLKRLRWCLSSLQIQADVESMGEVSDELISRNGLRDAEFAIFYIQITRGAAPRSHAFPVDVPSPTVYAFTSELVRAHPDRWERGFAAITVTDRRWGRVDIKTTNLLPNVFAQQAAAEAGVEDALFVRDGYVKEGTHNNVFVVSDGEVATPPATHSILHGVTRAYILELCEELGIPAAERPIALSELKQADEVFFTGTTTEVRPTVNVDGEPIGAGRPGPVTRSLSSTYRERVSI